eukprot:gene5931-9761_t
MLNIAVIGEEEHGKTSLLNVWTTGMFNSNESTDIKKYSLKYKIEDVNCMVNIFEIPGSFSNKERKENLKNTDGIIIVFDEYESKNDEEIKTFLNYIKKVSTLETVYLISSKSDLAKNKTKQTNLESLVEKYKLHYYETSAKENQNVNETFDDIFKKIYEHKKTYSSKKKLSGKLRRSLLESSLPDDELEFQ